MKKLVVVGVIVAIVAVGFSLAGAKRKSSIEPVAEAADIPKTAHSATQPATAPAESQPATESRAKNVSGALLEAAAAEQHLFVFVHEKDNEQTQKTRKVFDAAVQKLGSVARWFVVDRSAPDEREFVNKHGLNAAPMPIVLVFAPNGAIAGGFLGSRVTEQQLTEAWVSPVEQTCLKALQDRKLVLLCVRNGKTKSNQPAMKGVDAFKADEQYARFTEVVTVDPSDSAEKKFLTQLEIRPDTTEATTVLLAPPGSVLGKFTGPTEKDKFVAAIKAASSGGCSGKSGCCPTQR